MNKIISYAAILQIATFSYAAGLSFEIPAGSLPAADAAEMATQASPNQKAVREKLGASKDQIKRAIGRLDAEIWEVPGKHQASSKQVANLRKLQADIKSAKAADDILTALSNTGKGNDSKSAAVLQEYPHDMMKKIDAFLIGEAACQIMKESEVSGSAERLTRTPDRLLKESVLSAHLGHLSSAAELQDNTALVERTIKNLKRDYPAPPKWSPAKHAAIAELLKSQESKSEHWNPAFAAPTHNGGLGCASYVTNGKVAKSLGETLMPSLDLNVNGVVGESLLRGFQPRTVPEALEQAKNTSINDEMAFVIRPAVVETSFGLTENGHIGFLDATKAEVSHNKDAVGTRESVKSTEAFAPSKHPFVLVPPGWDRMRVGGSSSK